MKLKNKKTGEIGKILKLLSEDNQLEVITDNKLYVVKTLTELNEEWEDYKEQKDWIDEVKVQELPSGLKIADRDYYEFDEDGVKKTEFTWDEAMEIEKKTGGKWRLPTPKELNQMAVDLGYNDDGVFEGEIFAKNLDIEERFEKDGLGYYWSLRSANTIFSNCLFFNNRALDPQDIHSRGHEFAVRCLS